MVEFDFLTLGLAAEYLNKQGLGETFTAETVRALVAHDKLIAAIRKAKSGTHLYVYSDGADAVLHSSQLSVMAGESIEKLKDNDFRFFNSAADFVRELYIPREELDRYAEESRAESDSSGDDNDDYKLVMGVARDRLEGVPGAFAAFQSDFKFSNTLRYSLLAALAGDSTVLDMVAPHRKVWRVQETVDSWYETWPGKITPLKAKPETREGGDPGELDYLPEYLSLHDAAVWLSEVLGKQFSADYILELARSKKTTIHVKPGSFERRDLMGLMTASYALNRGPEVYRIQREDLLSLADLLAGSTGERQQNDEEQGEKRRPGRPPSGEALSDRMPELRKAAIAAAKAIKHVKPSKTIVARKLRKDYGWGGYSELTLIKEIKASWWEK